VRQVAVVRRRAARCGAVNIAAQRTSSSVNEPLDYAISNLSQMSPQLSALCAAVNTGRKVVSHNS